jgi:hypothetical protein
MSAPINGSGVNYISGKKVFTVNKETIKIFISIVELRRVVVSSTGVAISPLSNCFNKQVPTEQSFFTLTTSTIANV